MILSATEPKFYTAEEYLALEIEAETRHEFRNGEIVQMTGGTPAHNEITGDLIFLLKVALRGQPYSIFVTDQRLWIPAHNTYAYPDAMVVPRPVELQPGRKDTVTNPILIAEVLSDSTKAYDRGEKFAAYRTLSTFQEYLLIDQYSPHVELYVKQTENKWLFTEYSGLDARLFLPSISIEIALADLYENVEF
jgi:Uma2 family endonuclease